MLTVIRFLAFCENSFKDSIGKFCKMKSSIKTEVYTS